MNHIEYNTVNIFKRYATAACYMYNVNFFHLMNERKAKIKWD